MDSSGLQGVQAWIERDRIGTASHYDARDTIVRGELQRRSDIPSKNELRMFFRNVHTRSHCDISRTSEAAPCTVRYALALRRTDCVRSSDTQA